MKRLLLLLLCAISSVAVAIYAALQFFVASMAGSALVGVPSQQAAQRHYGFLSWLWFSVAVAAILALVVSVIAVSRLREVRTSCSFSSARPTGTNRAASRPRSRLARGAGRLFDYMRNLLGQPVRP